MSEYDSPWKEALCRLFQPFLELVRPEVHAGIDWSRGYQSLGEELRKIVRESRNPGRRVDRLRGMAQSGAEQCAILIHVEVQTSWDGHFTRRMYTYNYRLFDRYSYKVLSLAVLGDDSPLWRPQAYSYELWDAETRQKFALIKLRDYAAQRETLEQSRNPFAAVVLAHLSTRQTRHDWAARYAAKVKLIKAIHERKWTPETVWQLFRVIDWMMDLPKPLEVNFWQEINRYEQEKKMPFMTTPERIGREQGLAEGRVEGRAEGIELALKLKFGDAGLRLMPEIRAITDAAKLKEILLAIPAAATPEDLRRVWAG